MNFVIYHSALRPCLSCPTRPGPSSRSTGRIRWASDLAKFRRSSESPTSTPSWHVVANSAVAHPKFCAALVGTLIKGFEPTQRSICHCGDPYQTESVPHRT